MDQPLRSAYLVYMRSRSPANSADSSPPSPDFTSSSTSLLSVAGRGHQQVAQAFLGDGTRLLELLGLGRERLVLAGQLAGSLEVVTQPRPLRMGAQDRVQLGVPLVEAARQRLVGVHRRVRQLSLELRMLVTSWETTSNTASFTPVSDRPIR